MNKSGNPSELMSGQAVISHPENVDGETPSAASVTSVNCARVSDTVNRTSAVKSMDRPKLIVCSLIEL